MSALNFHPVVVGTIHLKAQISPHVLNLCRAYALPKNQEVS